MALQLRAWGAQPEDPGSIPASTQRLTTPLATVLVNLMSLSDP